LDELFKGKPTISVRYQAIRSRLLRLDERGQKFPGSVELPDTTFETRPDDRDSDWCQKIDAELDALVEKMKAEKQLPSVQPDAPAPEENHVA
jgi:hypothetical protein